LPVNGKYSLNYPLLKGLVVLNHRSYIGTLHAHYSLGLLNVVFNDLAQLVERVKALHSILNMRDKLKNYLKSSWALVTTHRRAYLLLNLVYYLLLVASMVYVAFDQELQRSLLNDISASFLTGPLAFAGEAYLNVRIFTALLATFFINLLVGAFGTITLPTLIIPFSGILVGAYRAILWGLLLSPANPDLRLVMIPHSITLFIEGQAYILTMLAAYIHGRAFFCPHTVGLESRRQGYLEGLKQTGKLYLLIILTLAIAAIYEIIEVAIMIQLSK
jgi:hypothetical protein